MIKHICNYCQSPCIKKGIRKGVQKFLCKNCHKYQQNKYTYKYLNAKEEDDIINLTKEGMGISSISRFLKISKSNVQRKILKIGNATEKPVYDECRQKYELDEMTVSIAGVKDIFLIFIQSSQHNHFLIFDSD